MSTPFASAINFFRTTLAAAHTAGSATFTMKAGSAAVITADLTRQGLPSLSTTAPLRFIVVQALYYNPITRQILDASKMSIYEATGLSGEVLSGSAEVEGTTNQAFDVNDILLVDFTAGQLNQLQAAIKDVQDNVPVVNAAPFIVQTSVGPLTNAQVLASLTTGLLKNTTATGVLSIATSSDYIAPGGSGASLTNLTAANISAGTAGINISGTAAVATTALNFGGTVAQSQVTNLTSDLGLKANLASPTFTGTVTAPTIAMTGTLNDTGSAAGGLRIAANVSVGNGVNTINGYAGNAINGGKANTIIGGGITGSEIIISSTSGDYNTAGGPYDCQIDTVGSVGANTLMNPHGRIFGNSSHTLLIGGSFHAANSTNYSGLVSGTGNTSESDQTFQGGGGGNHITSNGAQAFMGGGAINVINGLRAAIIGGNNGFVGGNDSIVGPGGNKCYDGSVIFGNANTIGNSRTVSNGAMTQGSATLTSATAAFVAGDVGDAILVVKAGARGANGTGGGATTACVLRTTISAVAGDGLSATLADPAGTSITNAVVYILTGDRLADSCGILSGSGSSIGTGTTDSDFSVIAGGRTNTINEQYGQIPGGQNCAVTGRYGMASGNGAVADKWGQVARASGIFATVGDAQYSRFTAFQRTTSATEAELRLDGVGGGQRLTINDLSSYRMDIRVIARRTDSRSHDATFRFTGIATRESGVATTTWTDIESNSSPNGETWSFRVIADTTNGAILLLATGQSSATIYWMAIVESVKASG